MTYLLINVNAFPYLRFRYPLRQLAISLDTRDLGPPQRNCDSHAL